MSNFFRLEMNLHIYGHIFLTFFISLFRPTKAKGTNVRQFPASSHFQIKNIFCCLSVISFYFPPLEVVHPVQHHCHEIGKRGKKSEYSQTMRIWRKNYSTIEDYDAHNRYRKKKKRERIDWIRKEKRRRWIVEDFIIQVVRKIGKMEIKAILSHSF